MGAMLITFVDIDAFCKGMSVFDCYSKPALKAMYKHILFRYLEDGEKDEYRLFNPFEIRLEWGEYLSIDEAVALNAGVLSCNDETTPKEMNKLSDESKLELLSGAFKAVFFLENGHVLVNF